MNIQIVIFGFGAMLLLIAIVGGGVEIRELKIPQVGRAARALAAFVGLCFIFVGGTMEVRLPGVINAAEPNSGDTRSVDFMVHDRLGENQVSEQVTILVDGRSVGTLTVDKYHPHAAVTISVPKSGRYSYTVEATAVFNIDGRLYRHTGVGQGTIQASAGKNFSLVGSFSGNAWLVTLMENS